MIRGILLASFFLVLALDELLNIGLLITVGLSAKNAFLFMLLIAIALNRAAESGRDRLQFPELHGAFFGLIGIACLWVFFRHFVSGYPQPFTLFQDLALVKGGLLDMYLMMLVFLYGVTSREAAVGFMKLILLIVSAMALVTTLDIMGMPNMGLVSYRNERLEGPLGQANEYAVFLTFFLPILLLAAYAEGSRVLRLLYALGALGSFALIMQTGSRSGFLSLPVGCLLAALWLRGGYPMGVLLRRGGVMATIGVVVVAALFAYDPAVRDLVTARLDVTTSAGSLDQMSAGRTFIWAQGLEYQFARPWSLITGLGWGSFTTRIGIPAHSAYMNIFFSLGVFGLVLFLGLVLRTLLLLREAFFSDSARSDERLFLAGGVIAWFALTVAMVTGTIYTTWLFVWPLTGLLLRLVYCIREDSRVPIATGTEEVTPARDPVPQGGTS